MKQPKLDLPLKNINLTADVTVEILTPVHIGGVQEKHLRMGVDYLHYNNMVYVLDPERLWKALEAREADFDTYLSLVANGSPQEVNQLLFEQWQLDPEILVQEGRIYSSSLRPNEQIQSMIRTGKQPLLPGSSLKGALSSVLFHHLHQRKDDSLGSESWHGSKWDEALLGKFDRRITRFLRVYDATFKQADLTLLHIVLFNLYRESSGWESGFKPDFLISCEALLPGSQSKIRLNLAEPLLNQYKTKRKLWQTHNRDDAINNWPKLFDSETPLAQLFHLINVYTYSHLGREIAFLQKYDQADGIAELLEAYKKLKEEARVDGRSCILRVGYGSGFHGITGDWRYQDHTRPINSPDKKNKIKRPDAPRGAPKESIRYKSRRLGRWEDKLVPLGFVRLTLPEEVPSGNFIWPEELDKSHDPSPQTASSEDKQPSRKSSEERYEAPQKPESSKSSPQKPRLDPKPQPPATEPKDDPVPVRLSSIEKGKTVFFARVIKAEKPMLVSLFIENGSQEAILSPGKLGKGVSFHKGQVIKVVAMQIDSEGRIKQVTFRP
mgnify:CR=1 FL=1